MSEFQIEGGRPLSGTITAMGNKNAALPLIAASLLTSETVTLSNLPRIGDVLALLTVSQTMGATVNWHNENTIGINSNNLQNIPLGQEMCQKFRGSILLAAPLLHRFGRVSLPFPGGDRIGRRRLDTHLLALSNLGAQIECDQQITITAAKGLTGADLLLDEASVTATENTLMAAALANGQTIIRNAACEPHVQQLCDLLNLMGADIQGVGTNQLTINGVESLKGAALTIEADYLEVASFMALAALTGGELMIKNAGPQYLRMILHQFRRLGLVANIVGNDLFIPREQPLRIQPDYRGAIPRLDDAPWPGFPADLTSVALVIACKSQGSVLIHEKMFESRLFFVDQLIEMGAQIVLCDPHRAVVTGSGRLHGGRINSPDIRAGMALLIASLSAEGKSVIGNIRQIDRGYVNIEERLRQIGAAITRVE